MRSDQILVGGERGFRPWTSYAAASFKNPAAESRELISVSTGPVLVRRAGAWKGFGPSSLALPMPAAQHCRIDPSIPGHVRDGSARLLGELNRHVLKLLTVLRFSMTHPLGYCDAFQICP